MVRIALILLCAIHGLIHLMGFVKAFNLAEMPQLTMPVSRGAGVLWLLATGMFLATAAVFALRIDLGWVFSLAAVIVSQGLIFTAWKDAKFGTVANVLIAAATYLTVCASK